MKTQDTSTGARKATDKIKKAGELQILCRSAQREERGVVFTNGCFDLLHVGHLRYLEAARNEGDILIVGVNTDASVHRIKGPLRPVIEEAERSELVAALHCVDYVVLFDTPDPLPLILLLQPDVLVKGADWPMDKIIGADEVLGRGGRVARIPPAQDRSTTSLIEKILARFGPQPHPFL